MNSEFSLSIDYLENEIEKVVERIAQYQTLYNKKTIKCITLKRLISSKEDELRLLYTLRERQ